MNPTDWNPADLDDLVDRLRTGVAGLADPIRSVDLDVARVNPPGVWVQFLGFGQVTMTGLAVRVGLNVLAPAIDPRPAMGVLAPIVANVLASIGPLGGPSGDVVATGLIIAGSGSSTPLPALTVPFDLYTLQE